MSFDAPAPAPRFPNPHGLPLFPLQGNSKVPCEKKFWLAASPDASKVQVGCNAGVITGNGLIVLDLDVKNGKDGIKALAVLVAFHDDGLPATFTVKTLTGGRHLYFRDTLGRDFGQGTNRLGPGIDVKADPHGYVVAAGSVIDGRRYEIISDADAPVAEAPEWLIAELLRSAPRSRGTVDQVPLVDLDTASNIDAAIAYLKNDAEEATQDAGGDEATFRVACFVRDYGISKPKALDLMLDHWNEHKAHPCWTPEDLAVKVRNAFSYAKNRHGSKAAALAVNEFPKLPDSIIAAIAAQTPPNLQPSRISTTRHPGAKPLNLSDYSIKAWMDLDIPPRDFLLGGLVATTSRILLYAPTGVGKTLFGLNLAAAVAAGKNFLRWEGTGPPRRVVYIDGEMPAETTKERAEQVSRLWNLSDNDNLIIINRDILASHEIEMPPLNTESGKMWLLDLVDEAKPDLIIFDNIMSLLGGSMLEEESWEPVKLLMRQLTTRHIGQIWLHHTGHDKDRAYGTSTRTWEMDMVIRLEAKDAGGFTMVFEKKRLAKPADYQLYEPLTASLSDQGWEFSDAPRTKLNKRSNDRTRMEQIYAQAVNDLIRNIGNPSHRDQNDKPVRAVDLEQVREHLKRHGRLDLNDTGGLEPSARKALNRAKGDLLASGEFAADETRIWKIGDI